MSWRSSGGTFRWPTWLIIAWSLLGAGVLIGAVIFINMANTTTAGCDTAVGNVAAACWASYLSAFFVDMLIGVAAWATGFVVLSLVWLMTWAFRMERRVLDRAGLSEA